MANLYSVSCKRLFTDKITKNKKKQINDIYIEANSKKEAIIQSITMLSRMLSDKYDEINIYNNDDCLICERNGESIRCYYGFEAKVMYRADVLDLNFEFDE